MTKRKKLSSALALLNNNSASEWSPTQLSVAPAAWFQPGVGVTGTLTASNWADQSGNGRDLAQGTAGNQPIYLPYSGTPYAYLPGVAGNYFSTPDSAALSVFSTGEIDVRVKAALNDWNTGSYQTLIAKAQTSTTRSYWLDADNTGKFTFNVSTDGDVSGIAAVQSTVVHGLTAGETKWVRVTLDFDNGSGSRVGKFYLSDDGETWAQLGSTVTTAGAAVPYDSNSYVELGSIIGGIAQLWAGKLYRAILKNGIDGTTVLDFNPADSTETSVTSTVFNSSTTGEPWTLNSTGAKPAQIVKSAQLMTVAASTHYMATAGFTLDQPCTWYAVMAPTGYNSGADQVFVFGETTTTNVALYNQNGGSNLAIYAGSTAASVAAPTAGAFHVFSAVFNGASSLWSYDAQAANTGDPGAGNPSGLTIGAGLSAAAPASARYKELIAFSAAHTAAERLLMQRYLANKYSIVL